MDQRWIRIKVKQIENINKTKKEPKSNQIQNQRKMYQKSKYDHPLRMAILSREPVAISTDDDYYYCNDNLHCAASCV